MASYRSRTRQTRLQVGAGERISSTVFREAVDLVEHDIQCQFFTELELLSYQGESLRSFFYAIPNGGGRSKAEAGKLKAEGVTRGIPDVCCFIPAQGFHGLYIEFKKPRTGSLSAEQKQTILRMRKMGYKVVVCRQSSQAINEVLLYLGMVNNGS